MEVDRLQTELKELSEELAMGSEGKGGIKDPSWDYFLSK